MSEARGIICPQLGLLDDRTVSQTTPTTAHRCYAQTPPGTPEPAYQSSRCLNSSHTGCPFYTPVRAPAAGAAPPARRAPRGVNWRSIVPVAVVAVLLLAVGVAYGRELLVPAGRGAAAATGAAMAAATERPRTPSPVPVAPAPPRPVSPAAQGGDPAQPAALRFVTPTPEPGGSTAVISPTLRDAGWWASGNVKSGHFGAPLQAGYFDNQVYVAAVRFDLRDLPPGAAVREATLRLTGQQADRLNTFAGGSWLVQFLDPDGAGDLARLDFDGLFNAASALTLEPRLNVGKLQAKATNSWTLDEKARAWLEGLIRDEVPYATIRILGPVGGAPTLFSWDSGASGAAGKSEPPQLVVSLGPPPASAPPLAARRVVVPTATPANVMTAAANAGTATAVVGSIGTFTPTPVNAVTATPLAPLLLTAVARGYTGELAPVVTATPSPANAATAQVYADYATAVAQTTGTFTPMPANAVTPFLVTPTPRPTNAMTAMARDIAATDQVQRVGTVTPLPFNAIIATVTPGPYLVTAVPTPENGATAVARAAYATAVAYTTGTFTPMAPGAMTPTPPPTATPLPLLVDVLTPAPTPTPTVGPNTLPPGALRGKILFRSDRGGSGMRYYVLDPKTGNLMWMTQEWPFVAAQQLEGKAPDGQRAALVRPVLTNIDIKTTAGKVHDTVSVPQLIVTNNTDKSEHQITVGTDMNKTWWSYDGAWSPKGELIAYVSTEAGNDEIYTISPDGKDNRRLTSNDWEWDKHPTWSPDGSEIVFWSNRETGRRQLWIMSADGSNQRKLIDSPFNDWDPIWVK
jgi:hypothetical protein